MDDFFEDMNMCNYVIIKEMCKVDKSKQFYSLHTLILLHSLRISTTNLHLLDAFPFAVVRHIPIDYY